MITITVKNKIRIKGLPPAYRAQVKKTLTLVNPKYFMMKNSGRSTWNVPKDFKYYEEELDDLIIPRGAYSRLVKFLDSSGLQFAVDTRLAFSGLSVQLKPIKLRDYQVELLDSLFKSPIPTEGIINMSTGSGKTVVALEVIRRLGMKATILVPNNVILTQFKEEANKFFNYDVGIINGFTKEIKDITVATFQSLSTNQDLLEQLCKQSGTVIVDEVQGVVSEKRRQVLQSFYPTNLYGITATPERGADGQTEAIFFMCGPEISKYESVQMKPMVEVIESKEMITMRANYMDMVEDMVNNKSRNTLIIGLVIMELLAGRKILTLTKRIQHYKNMESAFVGNENVHFIDSKNKDRNEILLAMKKGLMDFSAIFGTTSLLAVGTDVPSLDTLIIGCDLKSKVLTTQACGRVLRLFEDKQSPKIYDIVDTSNPVFFSQARSRLKTYKHHGWPVAYNGINSSIKRLI
jgi:superfamily II DNA or RNA helicase